MAVIGYVCFLMRNLAYRKQAIRVTRRYSVMNLVKNSGYPLKPGIPSLDMAISIRAVFSADFLVSAPVVTEKQLRNSSYRIVVIAYL